MTLNYYIDDKLISKVEGKEAKKKFFEMYDYAFKWRNEGSQEEDRKTVANAWNEPYLAFEIVTMTFLTKEGTRKFLKYELIQDPIDVAYN